MYCLFFIMFIICIFKVKFWVIFIRSSIKVEQKSKSLIRNPKHWIMQKQVVQSVFQNSLRTLVQVNTTYRKPEESLSTPFQLTSYSLLLTSLQMSGTYFPNYRTGKKYSAYLVNIICLILLSLLTLRNGFRVGMSQIST